MVISRLVNNVHDKLKELGLKTYVCSLVGSTYILTYKCGDRRAMTL